MSCLTRGKLTMVRLNLLAIAACYVACTAFHGSPLQLVNAKDEELSNDASTVAESAVEAANSSDKPVDPDCLNIGYDVEALDCRLCDLLALTITLEKSKGFPTGDSPEDVAAREKLYTSEKALTTCKKCCTDVEAIEAQATKQQYKRVVLEVCTCKFGRLPKIANFVQQHAAKHTRLEVKYINARMPHLLFYDDDDEKQEEISIASWDEETISEFIESKLKKEEEAEPVAEQTEETGDSNEKQKEEPEKEETEETEAVEEEADDFVEVEVSADGE